MTRDTIEDRETAALRSARLAYTHASRCVDQCEAEMRSARRLSLAAPQNKGLAQMFRSAKHRCDEAKLAMARARRLHMEAEASDRAGLSLAEIDDVA
jgi:hypothetical protein